LKYLCLVYGGEKEIGAMTDDECMAYDQTLRSAGRCLASEALQPVHTAATVRVRNGKVSIMDGPFTETKEVLAGFYLIDATDLNEAIQVASQIPPARVGSIEVRPVRELTSTSGGTKAGVARKVTTVSSLTISFVVNSTFELLAALELERVSSSHVHSSRATF
jgi:hypothetical protein